MRQGLSDAENNRLFIINKIKTNKNYSIGENSESKHQQGKAEPDKTRQGAGHGTSMVILDNELVQEYKHKENK